MLPFSLSSTQSGYCLHTYTHSQIQTHSYVAFAKYRKLVLWKRVCVDSLEFRWKCLCCVCVCASLFCIWKMAKFQFNDFISTMKLVWFFPHLKHNNEKSHLKSVAQCKCLCVCVYSLNAWKMSWPIKNDRLSNWLNGLIDSISKTNWMCGFSKWNSKWPTLYTCRSHMNWHEDEISVYHMPKGKHTNSQTAK